jgi:hypothetical protein
MPIRMFENFYRLKADNGADLGVIAVPGRVMRELEAGRQTVQVHRYQEIRACPPIEPNTCMLPGSFALALSPHGRMDESLCLYGIEAEELDKEPGFAFLPGPGYIRRLIGAMTQATTP